MFKRRHVNTTIVGQQLSGDDLSTVFGGQSREADDVDKQVDVTVEAWKTYLAPIFHPINETIRLIGLTERLVQRSLDHDVRWAITDQEAAQLRERLSEAEAQDPWSDAETDEEALAAGSAAMNAAAHAFHGQQSAAAAGSHNPSPSPNTPNPGPGAGGQSSSSGGPYR